MKEGWSFKMDKKKVSFKIGGVEYTITGYETEEYMRSVASYVDKKMEEVRQRCFSLDTSMLAVLTAVNIADETMELYDRIEELEENQERLQGQLEKAMSELEKSKSKTIETENSQESTKAPARPRREIRRRQ